MALQLYAVTVSGMDYILDPSNSDSSWVAIALAVISTLGTIVTAWLSSRATRQASRAASAAEDVQNRTRTNHGRDHIGEKVDEIIERQEQGHRILEQVVDRLNELSDRIEEHEASPHPVPRNSSVDLDEVEDRLGL